MKCSFGKVIVLRRESKEDILKVPSRFGIVVPGKLGNAVERNKAKRRIREALSPLCAKVKDGYDVSIILWTVDIDFQKARKELADVLSSLIT